VVAAVDFLPVALPLDSLASCMCDDAHRLFLFISLSLIEAMFDTRAIAAYGCLIGDTSKAGTMIRC